MLLVIVILTMPKCEITDKVLETGGQGNLCMSAYKYYIRNYNLSSVDFHVLPPDWVEL